MGIWTRKELSALESVAVESGKPGTHGMRRVLGRFDLILIGVGSTIGAGIFVITGTAAAQYAGPAIVISFIIAGLACLSTGFCYAELASMMPVAGSSYTYAYATLGELAAWTIGWCLVLEYTVAGSTIAVGWAGYFTSAMASLGIVIPSVVSSAPIALDSAHHFVLSGSIVNFPAVAIVMAMTALLVVGIKESAVANAIFVVLKIGVILLVVLVGAFYVHPENWHPFIPPNTGETGTYGWSGIFRGAGVIFFAYIGFETVSTCALETRNPQRDLGFSILMALLICTTLYVAMALVMTGLAPYTSLNVDDPIIVALNHAPSIGWLKPCVSVGAVVGLASTILMSVYGQSRIFYTMAQDGLLPPVFSRLHERFRTPAWGIVVVGTGCALIAGVLPLDILGELVSIGTLLAFAIVCLGVLVLRSRSPNASRGFRCPGSPAVPAVGIVSCLYLMTSLPVDSWWRLLIWLGIGSAIYVLYGARNSKANVPA
jgi:APA family basic amino acid/polyamine antiporter